VARRWGTGRKKTAEASGGLAALEKTDVLRDGTFPQPLMKHAGTTVPGCPGGDGCVADDGDGRTDQAAAVGEPLLRFDGSRRNAV
jgi:hypothetical protein